MESWCPIAGAEDLYAISDEGRVCNVKRWRMLQPSNTTGYFSVSLSLKGRLVCCLVHRLVASHFIGECPSGRVVNHINGHKFDNRASNLEYLTPKENAQHASRLGLLPTGDAHHSRRHPELLARGYSHWSHKHPERVNRGDAHYARIEPQRLARGESHGIAKLTDNTVRKILLLHSRGMTLTTLADVYGVSKKTILNVVHRRTWRHVK